MTLKQKPKAQKPTSGKQGEKAVAKATRSVSRSAKITPVEIKPVKMSRPKSEMSIGETIVDLFNVAGGFVKTIGQEAIEATKTTIEKNPALVDATLVAVTATLRLNPKMRAAIMAGHLALKIYRQTRKPTLK